MQLMRLLHILTSIVFISGLLGRSIAYAQARRADDIHVAGTLLQNSQRFEQWMVIPGSLALLLFGLLTAWLQGLPPLGGVHANWLLLSLVLFVSMIPIVVVVLIPRSKRRHAALTGALARGVMTAELRAALADKAVVWGRTAELLVVAVILVLMILKPF
jgi:uncharacterized membrane protein